MITKARVVYCALVAAALVVAGCNRSESTSSPAAPRTPAPSDTVKAPALPPGHPDVGMSAQAFPPGAAADAPNPHWTVPANWQEGKASTMRRATFVAKGADGQSAEIVVSVFPGDVGG